MAAVPSGRRFGRAAPRSCVRSASAAQPLRTAALGRASRSTMPRCLSPRENPVVSRSDGEEGTLPHRPHSSKLYRGGGGQGRPLASRRMTRREAAFPIFPSLSARDSQNRLGRSFSFGVEFVFLKKLGVSPGAHPCKQSRRRLQARDGRNVLTPSNYGPTERAFRSREYRPRSRRRFPCGSNVAAHSMPAPSIPVVMPSKRTLS